jgi:hydrogenase-4 component B
VEMRDLAWDFLYAPVGHAILFAAERLNPLQFLTIRQFLSFVFVALTVLLLVIALWS